MGPEKKNVLCGAFWLLKHCCGRPGFEVVAKIRLFKEEEGAVAFACSGPRPVLNDASIATTTSRRRRPFSLLFISLRGQSVFLSPLLMSAAAETCRCLNLDDDDAQQHMRRRNGISFLLPSEGPY